MYSVSWSYRVVLKEMVVLDKNIYIFVVDRFLKNWLQACDRKINHISAHKFYKYKIGKMTEMVFLLLLTTAWTNKQVIIWQEENKRVQESLGNTTSSIHYSNLENILVSSRQNEVSPGCSSFRGPQNQTDTFRFNTNTAVSLKYILLTA